MSVPEIAGNLDAAFTVRDCHDHRTCSRPPDCSRPPRLFSIAASIAPVQRLLPSISQEATKIEAVNICNIYVVAATLVMFFTACCYSDIGYTCLNFCGMLGIMMSSGEDVQENVQVVKMFK
ncbi:hypothetical protein LXL04_001518 [Taraxacum kok-saghyz]